MKKILLIPDVHGRIFWRDALKNPEQFDKIIFFGDYGDPYGHEGITHDDAISELRAILLFKRNYPNKVILLLGNHDLHYIDGEFACSRYSYQNRHKYKELIVQNLKLFQPAYEFEQNNQKYLCTHAGVSNGWLKLIGRVEPVKMPMRFLNKMFKTDIRPFGMYSHWRGGYLHYGSPMWADLREHDPLGAFSDYIQIFGHTQLNKGSVQHGNMWCIDSRQLFILENGELKEFNK